jgi:hypothetical protein
MDSIPTLQYRKAPETQGSSPERSGLLRPSPEAPRTPSGIDTPNLSDLERSLSRVVEGHRIRGLSASDKAHLIVTLIPEGKLTGAGLERLMHEFKNRPREMKALLHHNASDCGGSPIERAQNRSLLLLEVATRGLERATEQKDFYKSLQPSQRHTALAAFDMSEHFDGGLDTLILPESPGKDSSGVRGRLGSVPLPGSDVIVSESTQQLYDDFHVTLTTDTAPLTVKDGLEFFDSGTINLCCKGIIDTPKGEVSVIVKPMHKKSKVEGGTSVVLGIEPPPRYELRNIATSLVARELGFEDVVVRSRIGVYTSMENGKQKLGIVMEMAQGRKCPSVPDEAYGNGGVQREMTKLQLLDALVGQGDRHGGNIFVHQDQVTGKITVKGIDNDQCLGKKPSNPNDLQERKDNGVRGVALPPVIDTEMAKAFEGMTEAKLERLLLDKVTGDELKAAQERLKVIKDHIEDLRNKGRIIDPSAWGDRVMAMKVAFPSNSYFARELFLDKKGSLMAWNSKLPWRSERAS